MVKVMPMTLRSGRLPTARARRPAAARSERTRARVIETAGRMFAEQGFQGATGQAICRRARVNSAAIVYHFGGMAGLYRAVLSEALRRLLTTEAITAAVAAAGDPRTRLEAFLGLIVETVMSPASQSWPGKIFGREFVSPSRVYRKAHDRALAPRAHLVRSIVSELLGTTPDDPRVARSCISIMAPCALLLLVDRRKLQRLVPGLNLGGGTHPQLARHLLNFALAGLAALAAERRDR